MVSDQEKPIELLLPQSSAGIPTIIEAPAKNKPWARALWRIITRKFKDHALPILLPWPYTRGTEEEKKLRITSYALLVLGALLLIISKYNAGPHPVLFYKLLLAPGIFFAIIDVPYFTTRFVRSSYAQIKSALTEEIHLIEKETENSKRR